MERLKTDLQLPFIHDVDHKSHQIKLTSRNFFDTRFKSFCAFLLVRNKKFVGGNFLLDYVLMPERGLCLKISFCVNIFAQHSKCVLITLFRNSLMFQTKFAFIDQALIFLLKRDEERWI